MNRLDGECDKRCEDYLAYIAAHPELAKVPGDAGVIILRHAKDICRAEQVAGERAKRKGYPESWAHIGLVYSDEYLSIVRDPVRFPNGQFGTYIRVLQRRENFPGVAILAMHTGRIVLLEHYRHATRDWHWEIPRGFGESESAEQNATAELREELGAEWSRLEPLGSIHTNSGLLSERVSLFYAEISRYGLMEDKEAIRSVKVFPVGEVKDMLRTGIITDAFTVAAIGFAEWQGFIK